MVSITCDPQEVQEVKDALLKNPRNGGVGVLHEPTGRIYLAPFDVVPGGHSELVTRSNLRHAECKGFAVFLDTNGSFVHANSSHLNGTQGQPGSLQMPQTTFDGIVQVLRAAGL